MDVAVIQLPASCDPPKKLQGHLPSIYEMDTILDLGATRPTIDLDTFPNTLTEDRFWTTTTYTVEDFKRYNVSMINGSIGTAIGGFGRSVRCVRSPSVNLPQERYTLLNIVPDEIIVRDNIADFAWQECTAGLFGTLCDDGEAVRMIWEDALAYCEALEWGGVSDWRLPNRKELATIVESNIYNPATNIDAFPATIANFFWTSTPSEFRIAAGSVEFYYVEINESADMFNTYYVRCVRDVE